jgi:hypothetical protein
MTACRAACVKLDDAAADSPRPALKIIDRKIERIHTLPLNFKSVMNIYSRQLKKFVRETAC